MAVLYVAAGGGGDAVAAVMLHAARGLTARPVVATLAWDRLLVDPLPGPRGVEWFEGLEALAPGVWQVTGATRPIAPAGSTLPRLAADLDATVLLLDPYRGGRALAEQLAAAAQLFGVGVVTVVDVGGDVVARGDEAGLKSPTADALCLAAAAHLGIRGEVAVLGAGLDCELPEQDVRARIGELGGGYERTLRPEHVEAVARVFSWHPSEAAGALFAAVREGARGLLEVRDAGLQIELSELTTQVLTVPAAALAGASLLTAPLAQTVDFEQVEAVVRRVCGFTEMDIERDKAASLRTRATDQAPDAAELAARIARFEQEALERGSDFVSMRRLAESVGAPRGALFEAWRTALIRNRPDRYVRPLWSLRAR